VHSFEHHARSHLPYPPPARNTFHLTLAFESSEIVDRFENQCELPFSYVVVTHKHELLFPTIERSPAFPARLGGKQII